MPHSAIRMSQASVINDQILGNIANCVQLTLNNYAVLYNLNDEEPKPVNEIAAMHQLSDPQNFVDCGMCLQTSKTAQS